MRPDLDPSWKTADRLLPFIRCYTPRKITIKAKREAFRRGPSHAARDIAIDLGAGKLRVGIDAATLRSGGGATHLRELLTAARPEAAGISEIIVWGARATLDLLPSRAWLRLEHQRMLDGGSLSRAAWQATTLGSLARARVDVLYVPSGTYTGSYLPFVTMSRNLLPFDLRERNRYRRTRIGLRLLALGYLQTMTFRRASGVIFLTRTASETVQARTGQLRGRVAIIPHGVSASFFRSPRRAADSDSCGELRPFRWIYVSIIDLYKHQSRVAEAAGELRRRGYPVAVDFVGPAYTPALETLRSTMLRVDPDEKFLRYRGPSPHCDLPALYAEADAALFASSCENMPNILLESMASGLPIASSDRSVMTEVLEDGGVFFDPESPLSIADAMAKLMRDSALRQRCANRAFAIAQQYSWEKCARETLEFIVRVAAESRGSANRSLMLSL